MADIPNSVVSKSLSLIRELNKHYGTDKAHEIWTNLADLIDDGDLKMEIFKRMMGGSLGHEDQFILKNWDPARVNSKIPAIKVFRHYTDFGLKEAKWAIEDAETRPSSPFSLARHYLVNAAGESIDINHSQIIAEFDAAGVEIEFV